MPCPAQDVVYSVTDTLQGVRVPKPRRTPMVRFSAPRAGSTEAIIFIAPDGRPTVESVRSTGDHGSREEDEVKATVAGWTFFPATRNGCAVSFRETVVVTATPR